MAKYVRYTEDEWSAVYKDGVLVPETVGDHYYADEYFARVLEVETIDSDAFMRGGNTYADVANTLEEIEDFEKSQLREVNLENRVQVINGGNERWVVLKELSTSDCVKLKTHPRVMEEDGKVREVSFAEHRFINKVRN